MDACSANTRAADMAAPAPAPARAANSRAKSSSWSVNDARSPRRSRTRAPAGTPWPGSGVTTMEPTGPKPSGSTQAGAASGSSQRDGTGGKPCSASPSPGSSSG
ncbi:hypothetical protein, partial [Amycolatopsis mediterranei]|uniref:hypothetical protein n=1 Tax=Amycolatopsis mediterranei TaxID=33910 RepID=UPI0033174A6D